MKRFFPRQRLLVAAALALLALSLSPLAHGARTHVVQRGETLSSIAARYDVSVAELARANRLRDADMVKRGQELTIPDPPGATWTGSHTVASGETLSVIAARYRVSIGELLAANNIRDADLVRLGQVLLVPFSGSAPPATSGDLTSPAQVHTVKRRDTLSSIAAAYGVTVRDLARANNLRDADLLHPGQKLTIPQGAPAFIEHRVASGETLGTIASRYRVALADIRAANTLRNPNLISPGQVLRIPASDTALPEGETIARVNADPRQRLPSAIRAAIQSARVKPGRWKNIVVHHSGTRVGSGKGMDRYHREERHMENGLAYHFVIGNGRGMTDGSIFVGRRWNQQLDGGHVASADLNQISIGICLVGDFENHPPSRKQIESLEALVRALMSRTGLNYKAFTTHRLIHPKHTLCPGKHFPTEHFRQLLRAR